MRERRAQRRLSFEAVFSKVDEIWKEGGLEGELGSLAKTLGPFDPKPANRLNGDILLFKKFLLKASPYHPLQKRSGREDELVPNTSLLLGAEHQFFQGIVFQTP